MVAPLAERRAVDTGRHADGAKAASAADEFESLDSNLWGVHVRSIALTTDKTDQQTMGRSADDGT
jgi:hypothetical protein